MKDVLFFVTFLIVVAVAGFLIAAFVATRKFWENQVRLRERYRQSDNKYVLLLHSFSFRRFFEEEGPWTFGPGEGFFRAVPERAVVHTAYGVGAIGVPVMIGPVQTEVAEPEVGVIQAWSFKEDWFNLFVRLADGARAILVLPEKSPSLLAELKHIQSNRQLLDKTIILVPPASRDPSRWDAITNILASLGVSEPNSLTGGAVCMSSRTNITQTAIRLEGNLTGLAVLRALGTLVENIPVAGMPVSQAISLIESVERLSRIVAWYVTLMRRQLRKGANDK